MPSRGQQFVAVHAHQQGSWGSRQPPQPSSRGTQVRLLLAPASLQGRAAAPAVFRLKQPPAGSCEAAAWGLSQCTGTLDALVKKQDATCFTCIILGKQPSLGLQPERSLKCFQMPAQRLLTTPKLRCGLVIHNASRPKRQSYTPESALSSLSSLFGACSLALMGACCTSAAADALRFSAGVGATVGAAS